MTLKSVVHSKWRVVLHRCGHASNVMRALLSRQITLRSAIIAWGYPVQVKFVAMRHRRGMLAVCPDTIEEMFAMDSGSRNGGHHERS